MLWLQVGTMNFLWERISKECGKDSRHRSTRDSSVPFPQSISEGHSSTSSSEHQHPWPSKPFRVGFNSILWSLTRFVVNRDVCYLPSSTLPYQFLTMSALYTGVPFFFSRSAEQKSLPPWPHVLEKAIIYGIKQLVKWECQGHSGIIFMVRLKAYFNYIKAQWKMEDEERKKAYFHFQLFDFDVRREQTKESIP